MRRQLEISKYKQFHGFYFYKVVSIRVFKEREKRGGERNTNLVVVLFLLFFLSQLIGFRVIKFPMLGEIFTSNQ
jgi:hypothetical protein